METRRRAGFELTLSSSIPLEKLLFPERLPISLAQEQLGTSDVPLRPFIDVINRTWAGTLIYKSCRASGLSG